MRSMIRILFLLAAFGLIAGLVFGFFGFVHPAFDTFAHFRWHFALGLLAMAIAGHVLRRNIEEAPATCVRLAREALELAVGARHLRMFVHPQDLAEVEELLRQATSRLGDAITSEIVPDPRVGRGGCRVETEYGEIDQSWESQLARIEEELI